MSEMKGSVTRNENKLRIKIIQEIEAVCGDLYPDANDATSAR